MNWLQQFPVLMILLLTLSAARNLYAQEPYTRPDDAWISLKGVVHDVDGGSFDLNYGDGIIEVEMDEGGGTRQRRELGLGEEVIVYGHIDSDAGTQASIEAGSVYLYDEDVYYYASTADEEGALDLEGLDNPGGGANAVLRGTVVEVGARGFVLNNGARNIPVTIGDTEYSPMYDRGYLNIEAGDRVSVTGMMNSEFFDGQAFDAQSVVVLRNAGMEDRPARDID